MDPGRTSAPVPFASPWNGKPIGVGQGRERLPEPLDRIFFRTSKQRVSLGAPRTYLYRRGLISDGLTRPDRRVGSEQVGPVGRRGLLLHPEQARKSPVCTSVEGVAGRPCGPGGTVLVSPALPSGCQRRRGRKKRIQAWGCAAIWCVILF